MANKIVVSEVDTMDVDQFKKQKAELQKQIASHGKKMLAIEFKKFLDTQPNVESIRWEQYTPYFNDGDSCEFGRHDFSVKLIEPLPTITWDNKISDTAKESEDTGGYFECYLTDPSKKKADPRLISLVDAVNALAAVLNSDLDDVFLDTFGDHVQVTCSRRGFKVEDNDHD